MKKILKWTGIISIIIVALVVGIYKFYYSGDHFGYDEEKNNQIADLEWVETVATITKSEKMDNGEYVYVLEYNVEDGVAKNIDGEIIEGIISQSIYENKMDAVLGQKIEIQYMKSEPVLYKLSEEIKTK